MLANDDTGLAAPDVFYFGYSAGEAHGDLVVDYNDVFEAIWPALFGPTVGPDSPLDMNRDHVIDYGDIFNPNTVWDSLFDLPPLSVITPPGTPPPGGGAYQGDVFGGVPSWTYDLWALDQELYGSSDDSEEDETDDTLEQSAVDTVFADYEEE